MSEREFCEQLEMVKGPIRGMALKLTRNEEDAEDLWQDAVIKAYTHRASFKPGTNFKAWMFTILRNTFITRYHQVKSRQTILDDRPDMSMLNAAATTENGAMDQFLGQDLDKAINRLPDGIRKVINMRRRGFKYHEIADRMRLPLGTVKNKIFLAREQLRKSLAEYEFSS